MQIFLDIFSWVCQIVSLAVVTIFYALVFCTMVGLFFAIFFGPPVFMLRLPQWLSSQGESNLAIKYDTFISMYGIKPNAWTLEDDTVVYKSRVNDTGWPHDRLTTFYFSSYIDYRRYRRFLKSLRKKDDLREQQRIKVRSCEELERIVDCWKKDIEVYKSNNEAEIRRKLKEINQFSGWVGDNDV